MSKDCDNNVCSRAVCARHDWDCLSVFVLSPKIHQQTAAEYACPIVHFADVSGGKGNL